MSGGLFPPVLSPLRPLAVVSLRLPIDISSSLSLTLYQGGLSRPRVSSLSISTVVDVSVETEDPTTPPANHAAVTPSFLGKAKRKQITAQSSRELQTPLIPARLAEGARFFDLACSIQRILILGIYIRGSDEPSEFLLVLENFVRC